MQSRGSKQEREGEWGREDGGQKHRGILLTWLHLPRKCSPLFSHKTLTSGQLWTTVPEEEGTCQDPPALVYHWSLSFIIGPTSVNPPFTSELWCPVPREAAGEAILQPMMPRFLWAQKCWRSQHLYKFGQVRSEPQEAADPLLQWTKLHPRWSSDFSSICQAAHHTARRAWRQVGLSKSERGHKVVWYQQYRHACFCRTDHVLLNGRNPLLSVIFVAPEAKGKLSIPDWTKPRYDGFFKYSPGLTVLCTRRLTVIVGLVHPSQMLT